MLNALKKLRKNSESQTSNNELARFSSITSNGNRRLSRTKSLTRRFSVFSSNSNNSDVVSYNSDNQEESYQLSRFKSLNFDKFDNDVLRFLKVQGLSAPRILADQPNIRISLSSTGDDIFLPSLVAFPEEEQMDLDLNSPINISAANNGSDTNEHGDQDGDIEPGETILSDDTGHYSAPHNDDSADPTSHTFAVIVSLFKPTSISVITTQLQTNVNILWPKGLPSDRSIKKESFEIGQCSWDLNISNYNYFVPLKESAIDDEDDYSNFENIELSEMDTSKFLTDQKIEPKVYRLKTYDQVIRGGYTNYKKQTDDPFIIGNLQKSSGSIFYPPGDYIFLLPIQIQPTTPESLITEKAHVYHKLKTIIVGKGNKDHDYAESLVNIIRGPPVNGITTVDKPIFVNKTWSDSLNYEISFPKKYVTIGSEIPIKMKFSPLAKNVSVKRIKVNILEKVTYTSKDLKYEFEEERIPLEYQLLKRNERVIPLLEIRTKSRASISLRQEVVEAFNDNLLSCVGEGMDPQNKKSAEDSLIGLLQISSYISFVKPQKPYKFYEHVTGTTKNPLLPTITNPRKISKKQISEGLKTKMINQNVKVIPEAKFHNEFVDGLFADSLNNKYVRVGHKLQISLRITKTDPETKKLHHYEVMIDTPIFLLNSLCVPDSVLLPSYEQTVPRHIITEFSNMDIEEDGDEIHHLPTFEEATSPMGSPTLGPFSPGFPNSGEETIHALSRTSTIATAPLGYGHIDNLIDNNEGSGLEPYLRRGSATKQEIMNSFRRTISHTSYSGPEEELNSSGYEDEVHNSAPPNYDEVLSLLSDDGSDDRAYSVNEFSGISIDTDADADASVDMTELRRVIQ